MGRQVRRQHVVPRFYLDGFSNEAGRIERLELPGDRTVVMTTRDAGVVKDYYTVTLSDGSATDAFERWFSGFEGRGAAALRQIENGIWPLPSDSRRAIAELVALQNVRSEEVRNGQGALTGFHVRLLVGASGKAALRAHIERAEQRTLSDAELDWEWADLTKPGGPTLLPDAEEHMQYVLEVLPALSRHLMSWHWSLIRFERKVLGTSDHPVSLAVDESHPSWRGVGIATADLFSFPLSRRLALTIQPRERFPASAGHVPDFLHAGTAQLANSLNQETARTAKRYLFQRPGDAPFAPPVVLPEPRLHGWSDTGADHFIREEGLYSGVSDADLNKMPDLGGGDGMTLSDLPWPIPGRQGAFVPESRED